MRVDGFPVRSRAGAGAGRHRLQTNSTPSSKVIQQDPILSQVKLIAEPWDVGEGGYQVGNFSGAVFGVERKISRRDAQFLARGRRFHWAKWPID